MKSFNGFSSRMLRILIIVFVIIFFAVRCNDTGTKDIPSDSNDGAAAEEAPAAATVANNEVRQFQQLPPIADQIMIRKLKEPDNKGNTVAIMVQFQRSDKRLNELKEIPITLGDNAQLLLSDNRREGDEKPGDGIFTALMAVKPDEVINLMKRNNELIRKQKNEEVVFVNRSAVTRKLIDFDLASFDAGKTVLLTLPFTSIVGSLTLPDIRKKSLMITDLSVVEDKTRTYDPCATVKGNPAGVWSFGSLITNMANQPVSGVTPKAFLIDWVNNFLFSAKTLASGDASTVRPLSKEKLVKAWMKNSGLAVPPAGGVPEAWETKALKVEEFPVRLMAIVNRLDLRGNIGYGGVNNAGEGRFVFCFADSRSSCGAGGNGPGTMTFILEYGIPITNCTALTNFATKWWNLRTTVFGSAFNANLQGITEVFTKANAKASGVNKSALNHLRSNDFLPGTVNISVNPWDIRDFELDALTKKLKMIHPNREPMESSNGLATVPINPVKLADMVSFANSIPFTTDINTPYTIPGNIQGIHAPMRVNPLDDYHFRGDAGHVISPLNRREFSFNACSGCHKGETNNPFTHVRPRNAGSASTLSGFMTGLGSDDNPGDSDVDAASFFFVNDPGPAPLSPKQFNEALNRAISLEKLVFGSPCFVSTGFAQQLVAVNQVLNFRPINMEH